MTQKSSHAAMSSDPSVGVRSLDGDGDGTPCETIGR